MRLDESLLAGRFTSAEDYTFLLGLTTDWNTKLKRDEVVVGGRGGGIKEKGKKFPHHDYIHLHRGSLHCVYSFARKSFL